jgi:LysR family transcriptional regulator for bpeEF and oprC
LNPASFVNDFISIKSMAVNGAGIALLPEYAAYEDVRSGQLITVLNDWCGPVSELNAIYPSRRGATAKVRLLIDQVKQHLSNAAN